MKIEDKLHFTICLSDYTEVSEAIGRMKEELKSMERKQAELSSALEAVADEYFEDAN